MQCLEQILQDEQTLPSHRADALSYGTHRPMEAYRHLADQAVVGALLREIDLAGRVSSRVVLLVDLAEEDDDRDLNVVELVAAAQIQPEWDEYTRTTKQWLQGPRTSP